MSISFAYFALVPAEVIAMAEHSGASLCLVDKLSPLPFDHNDIIAAAVDRIRKKSQYSSLPCHLAGEAFTLPKLQIIYEACLGGKLKQRVSAEKWTNWVCLKLSQSIPMSVVRIALHNYRLKPKFKDCLQLLARGL